MVEFSLRGNKSWKEDPVWCLQQAAMLPHVIGGSSSFCDLSMGLRSLELQNSWSDSRKDFSGPQGKWLKNNSNFDNIPEKFHSGVIFVSPLLPPPGHWVVIVKSKMWFLGLGSVPHVSQILFLWTSSSVWSRCSLCCTIGKKHIN